MTHSLVSSRQQQFRKCGTRSTHKSIRWPMRGTCHPVGVQCGFRFHMVAAYLHVITGDDQARFLDRPFDLLDIWAYWGQSVPLTYTAPKTASGKFLSTSAESAFRFENQQPDFVERHIAWHDVQIEKQILLRALVVARHSTRFAIRPILGVRYGVTSTSG